MKLKKLLWILKNLFRKKNISLFALVDFESNVSSKARVNRLCKIYKSNVGRYTYMGSGTIVTSADIGNFCSISWNCLIGLRSHPIKYISTSPIFYERENGTGFSWTSDNEMASQNEMRTNIGSDVWIGANSIVMCGVTIGHGSVVAAGAIVTRNVPPYSIVAGVPARIIDKRFGDKLADKISESCWWDKPECILKKNINLFQKNVTPDIDLTCFE